MERDYVAIARGVELSREAGAFESRQRGGLCGHFFQVVDKVTGTHHYYFEFKYEDLIKCKTLQDYTEMVALAIIQAEIAGDGQ